MVKHIWSVLCQRSVVDSQTNNVSLIDVFERLEVNIAPTDAKPTFVTNKINLPIQYELVSFWTKTRDDSEEKASIKIIFEDPKKEKINIIEKELVIPPDKRRMRDINRIQGITLTQSGIYKFFVDIKQSGQSKFERAAEIPLEVVVLKGN